MKKLFSLLFASALLFTSCDSDSDDQYEALNAKDFQVTEDIVDNSGKANNQTCSISTIIANETIQAGKIVISSDPNNLIITFSIDGGWQIDATNVFVGQMDEVPTWSSGNPRTNRFPYRATHGSGTNQVVYTIPFQDIATDCFVVLGHGIVTKLNASGNPEYCTNAWVEGKKFSGPNWAMVNSVCKTGCMMTKRDQPIIEGR